MMLIETPPIIATGIVGQWLSIFEGMPTFPGKVVVYLLVGLSIVSWSVISYKSLLLNHIRNSDIKFRRRLRQSKTCLEVYEEDHNYEPSMLFEVYHEGSRAAAIEMAGSPDPRYIAEQKLDTYGSMNRAQLNAIDDAFEIGEEIGSDRLKNGFRMLRIVAIGAPVVGFIGACWIFMTAMTVDGEAFGQMLTNGLFIIAGSLCVSVPAGIARIHFLNQCRRRIMKVRKFRTQVLRVFGDTFENQVEQPLVASTIQIAETPAAIEPPIEPEFAEPIASTIPEPIAEISPPQPVAAEDLNFVPAPVEQTIAHELPLSPEPIVSPFSLDETEEIAEPISVPGLDSMVNHEPVVDYQNPVVPNFDSQRRRPPANPVDKTDPDHPYVSANY